MAERARVEGRTALGKEEGTGRRNQFRIKVPTDGFASSPPFSLFLILRHLHRMSSRTSNVFRTVIDAKGQT